MAKVPKQEGGVGGQVSAAKWRSGLWVFPQKLGIAGISTRSEVPGSLSSHDLEGDPLAVPPTPALEQTAFSP